MPAQKTGRQQVKRAVRTRGDRTETRTAIAKALRSVDEGDVAEAEIAVRDALSIMDRAVQKGEEDDEKRPKKLTKRRLAQQRSGALTAA